MTDKQINTWLGYIDKGLEDFTFNQNQLRIKFGEIPKDSDVIWCMLNNYLLVSQDQSMVYNLMANFLITIENKSPFELIKQSREHELKRLLDMGINMYPFVTIKTVHEYQCKAAKKLQNKKFKTTDALINNPLPCSECENIIYGKSIPYCTCYYDPVTD